MPKLIALIVILLLMTTGFYKLGAWQWGRMQERQAQIVAMEHERAQNRVSMTGVFDHNREVVLESQMRGREAGYRILTPLVIDRGVEVIVDRGWIKRSFQEGFLDAYKTQGVVTVEGVAVEPPTRHGWIVGPVEGVGAAPVLQFLDLSRIPTDDNHPRNMNHYVQADKNITPNVQAFLSPLPNAEKHREYALTWFSFAVINTIGGIILVYRLARKRKKA